MVSSGEAIGSRDGHGPWTNIFSTSADQTSLPSLRSSWCLRWGVRVVWGLEEPSSAESRLSLEAEQEREELEAEVDMGCFLGGRRGDIARRHAGGGDAGLAGRRHGAI